jgi:hypothetical protein
MRNFRDNSLIAVDVGRALRQDNGDAAQRQRRSENHAAIAGTDS